MRNSGQLYGRLQNTSAGRSRSISRLFVTQVRHLTCTQISLRYRPASRRWPHAPGDWLAGMGASADNIGFKAVTRLLGLSKQRWRDAPKSHFDPPSPRVLMLSTLLPTQVQKATTGRAVHERAREQRCVGMLDGDVDLKEQQSTLGRLARMDRTHFVLNAEVNEFGNRRARLLSVMDQPNLDTGGLGHGLLS